MLEFIPTKILASKLIHLFVIPFLIFLLTVAFTSVINTQNPYKSLNSPELFNTLEYSYQMPAFFYSSYTLDSEWLSLISSYNSAGRYYIPFSQHDSTNYFFELSPNWSFGVDYEWLKYIINGIPATIESLGGNLILML